VTNIPSIRTHPVVMSLATVIVVIFIYLGGVATGYWLYKQLEHKMENKIIRDDEIAAKKNDEEEAKALTEVYNNAEILNSFEESDCAKCWNRPLPDAWDVIMQPERERPLEESD